MRAFTRSISAFGLGCLLCLAASSVGAGEAGRDFALCVRACDNTRAACVDQCLIDCRALFPQNGSQRGACMSACTRTCLRGEADCKMTCKAIKEGGSPNQP